MIIESIVSTYLCTLQTDVKSMPLSMFIQQEKTLVYDRRLDHSSPISSRDVCLQLVNCRPQFHSTM